MSGNAGIFFSVWVNEGSERTRRLYYNIHSIKVRQLKTYALTSRKFADAFRREFKAVRPAWPNVSIDYGPLTLMEGWVELKKESFETDVLDLLQRFEKVGPIIDRLLEANKK